ncbi:flavoprotein-like protein [Chytriomyces sp. MP71]|nr:flavoprotein-like protein [Chytriomyces sp. MP71]
MVTIGVVLGSVRPARNGLRVGHFVRKQLVQRPNVAVTVIDPLELNLPILTNRYEAIKNAPDCPPALHGLKQTLDACDAFVIVSPEYNHTIPPAITNTLSYFYTPEFYAKPAGIVTYSMGPFGGSRASVAIPPLLGELGAVPTPKHFGVGMVHKALDEAGEPEKGFEWIPGSFKGFADELVWFTKVLKDARANGLPGK